MALDKDTLEEKIRDLLDLTKDPKAADETDCATKISEYVDAYLAGIELDAFPAAGVTAPPASVPDPMVATGGEMAEKTEPAAPLLAAQFKVELIAVMTGKSGDFTTCGVKFVADMATMAAVTDAGGYAAAGVSECATPPDLNAAFAKGEPGGKDHVAVAKEIANQIHTATTSTTFEASGPYINPAGPYLQTPPAPLYASSFK